MAKNYTRRNNSQHVLFGCEHVNLNADLDDPMVLRDIHGEALEPGWYHIGGCNIDMQQYVLRSFRMIDRYVMFSDIEKAIREGVMTKHRK